MGAPLYPRDMRSALLWPREFVKIAFADTTKVVLRKKMEQHLEPGDIIMMSMEPPEKEDPSGPLGALVSAYRKVAPTLQGDMGHSALYVGKGHLVEARAGEKVSLKPLYDAIKNKDILAIRPVASQEEKNHAVNFAMNQIGKDYDNKTLAFTSLGVMVPEAVTRLMNKAFKQDSRVSGNIDKWTCSNLVASAYPGVVLDSAGISVAAPVSFRNSKNVQAIVKTKPRLAGSRPTWGRAVPE